MVKIRVVEDGGAEVELDGSIGYSLMDVLRNRGAVEASCGGQCACATCHVYVDDAWLPRVGVASETELDLLDSSFEKRPNSRLSCQILLTAEHEGLAVTVAPPEG